MVHSTKRIEILIIAAGASKRMGRPKQLLPWGKHNLLEHTFVNAKNSNAHAITIVLGANAEKIQSSCNLGEADIILNTEWAKGMGTSISCGISHILEKEVQANGILILLGDQPFLDTDYMNELIQTFSNNPDGIIGTQYKQGVGVPAIFSAVHFLELKELNGDMGAKRLIKKYNNKVIALDPDKKITDIDTWKTYQSLVNNTFNPK